MDLETHIRNITQELGYITFNHFMSIVIPYYYKYNVSIGKDGDFITAPEVSSLFGMSIAKWVTKHIKHFNYEAFDILELGPGNGTLCNDILNYIEIQPKKYLLYDGSDKLIAQQQRLLSDHKNIKHISNLNEIDATNLFIIANEFFDAFPVSQFTKNKHEWHESVLDKNLNFAKIPRKITLDTSGSVYEYSSLTHQFLLDLSQHLTHRNVHFLIIDYGYCGDLNYCSLQALKSHKKVKINEYIGHADVTAHVDFKAISHNLSKVGFKGAIVSQKDFLESHKIIELANSFRQINHSEFIDLTLNKLLNPSEMGNFLVYEGISRR
jgi:NADH dehydrogenase [ubiquinone] 1 alpha subcomplex assembly factor 7